MLAPKLVQRIGEAVSGRRIALRPCVQLHDPFIASAILALEKNVKEKMPLGPVYGETIAAAIATHLVNHYVEIPSKCIDYVELSAEPLHRMRDYIEAHLTETILLTDLAAVAGIPIHQVAHAFKKGFGVTPHRYIVNARVRLAKSLLRTSTASLIEVALHTGFSSHSHFTKVFTKLSGLSPSQYRNTVR
jgi:AraC family transcriptional regulator